MKKKGMWRVLVGMTLAVLGMSVAGAVARPLMSAVFAEEASEPSTMAVSPMWQTMILVPGDSTKGSVRVRNPATATQNLKYSVSIGSFSKVPNDESDATKGTTTDVTSVSSYNQMMNWISLDRTSGEVAPNEYEDVEFTVNVPSDAPAGGQYASIIIKNETDKGQSGGNVMIQSETQTASVIYAEVTGETREQAQVVENNLPGFLTSGLLEATSVVENTGNVHADVTYSLQVSPLGSSENVCAGEDEESETVERIAMPEAKMYHVERCELDSVGIYQAKQTIKVFDEVSEVQQMVIVCPIWLIIVVVIVLVLVIGLIVRLIVKRRK